MLVRSTLLFIIAAVSVYLITADATHHARSQSILQFSAPTATSATKYTISEPLSKLSADPARRQKVETREVGGHGEMRAFDTVQRSDTATSAIDGAMPPPLLSFDGISNFDNIAAYSAVVLPPDSTGDVGPQHFVQTANLLVRVYDKTGSPLTPPLKLNKLFERLATPCSLRNDGLPTVLYDAFADRWLISVYCYIQPPFRQMIAISTSGDPTGTYHLYEFVMPNVRINDLAKFGVWTDAYLMTTEEILGSDYRGAGVFAFDREKMLAGDPTATYMYYGLQSPSGIPRNLMPIDLDGLNPPPPGMPGLIAGYSATEYGDAVDAIRLFEFRANFDEPLNSTFTERPESPIAVSPFDPTSPAGRTDINQPPPGLPLDSNSDRLAFRASYRNFGDHDSLIFSHTIRIDAAVYRAGQRVYRFQRNSAAGFLLDEELTVGNGTSSRWIGSAAQDHRGNIAFGYNVVDDATPPSIAYSGRGANDAPGTVRAERLLIEGTGVQKAFGFRWGDYSSMTVDPLDDCTFWMTGQYYTLESQNFSDYTWLTRIGSFRFPECEAAQRASISGRVTNAATQQPIRDAVITVSAYSRITDAGGVYGPLAVVPGSYRAMISKLGFRDVETNVTIANGETRVVDAALEPIILVQNSGSEIVEESCTVNGVAEPGETVTMNIAIANRGALNASNLTAELLANDNIEPLSSPQTYGPMPSGGPQVTRPFMFRVANSTACGGEISLLFKLTDGLADAGTFSLRLTAGADNVAFSESFNRVQNAGLPQRWTRSTTIPELAWSISSRRSTSPSRAAYSPDPIFPGLNELVSPSIFIGTANARLTFQNWYELETTFLRNRLYDGAVLEIKIGSGEWMDILDAGGVFESGGYDGAIDACCQNPLANRLGWSGRSGIESTSIFITSAVRLPAAAAGNEVRFRWRVGTDIGGFREGQYLDDIRVTDGFACSCPAVGN